MGLYTLLTSGTSHSLDFSSVSGSSLLCRCFLLSSRSLLWGCSRFAIGRSNCHADGITNKLVVFLHDLRFGPFHRDLIQARIGITVHGNLIGEVLIGQLDDIMIEGLPIVM